MLEADVLNMALFGMTTEQWRDKNPYKKGNIRDYASINEPIYLSNMENINAVLIHIVFCANQFHILSVLPFWCFRRNLRLAGELNKLRRPGADKS